VKKPPYSTFFPPNSDKKIITALRPLVRRCDKVLEFTQMGLRMESLKLSTQARTQLAEILVDFAMDIHFDTGLWTALEKYNTELFGTPLPVILPTNAKPPSGICFERVQFLLWNLYQQLAGCELSNCHVDLLCVADRLTEFLNNILLPLLPAVSPVKDFLDKPNDYGWEVKKKLIWLGMHSYLFRSFFDEYINERYDGKVTDIMIIDDFICQATTQWSGLGACNILAACLDVPDEQRDELRSWYLRHFSLYKIIKTDKEIIEAVNLINDAPYRIRVEKLTGSLKEVFRPNSIIYGSLVPWRGEWYWSGTQRDCTSFPKKDIANLIRQLKQNTQVVARYWKEREKMVLPRGEEMYQQALEFYGDNLVEFPDGRVFERSEQKRLLAHMRVIGQEGRVPRFALGEQLKECDGGVATFFDPVEGQEIMDRFDEVRSCLKKNGNCTEDEGDVIRGWIDSPSISPGFVYRVLKKYGGAESIKRVFCWETDEPYWLEYLLYCRKGKYYRRRFPNISIVDSA
jgi:hypothetical protein